ncbi:MAG: galactitol-1-phosphate 5-dehydrogenase [Lachnospiraceae bacterium]|nr:galactitol-1-phosphate 5-dehydrogenase [Lachnospiraceae bacterium]
MKAWVLKEIGEIEYTDIPKPEPAPGEALIKVCAAGICGSDVPRVYKTGAHKMPLVIGHEFSGIVEAVCSGEENKYGTWTGKRVGIFPLIPCGECGPCKMGRYEMCRHYDYVGSRRDGAFAEYVTVPVKNLIELPENVTYEEAAMLEPMAVAVHAIRRGSGLLKSKEDSTVGVCGLGTIGMLVTEFLAEAGFCNIYVFGRKDSQRQLFGRIIKDHLGLKEDELTGYVDTHYCDTGYCDPAEFMRNKSTSGDIGLFFECVGTNETVDYGLRLAAPGAGIVLVGNPASDIKLDRDIYWKILRNQLTLTGTWNSSFYSEDDDWHYVLERLKAHKVSPKKLISHRFAPEELDKGLMIMRDKSEDYCKVMTVIA